MAPSVSETISETASQVHEKLASLSVAEAKDNIKPEQENPAPAVQEASVATQALLETQHREPLILSGALDHFESFDVTPVIGREFVGVNLAKWIRAPNSNELLRDLAITSKI